MYEELLFSTLLGKTLVDIKLEKDAEEALFTTNEGEVYRLYHQQDCCEFVSIEDIIGDPINLLNSPLTMAEEVEAANDPVDFKPEFKPESYTWTFYKLATLKGYVTIRWYGQSNGYYSEGVSFEKK